MSGINKHGCCYAPPRLSSNPHCSSSEIYLPIRITMASTMKAVNYQGPYKVKVSEVSLPKILHPDDVIVKVTTVR